LKQYWIRIAENASWFLLEKFIRLVGSVVVGAWVARYLGPSEYGILAFAISLVGLVSFFGSLGLESFLVRDLVQQPGREGQILSTYLLIRLAGAWVAIALAIGYVAFVHPEDRGLLLIIGVLCSGTLFSAMEGVECALQARRQARKASVFRAIAFIAASLFKCGLVLLHAPLIWFALATVTETMLIALLYRGTLSGLGVRFTREMFDRSEARHLFFDGKYMILSALTVVIYSKIDLLVVGELLPKEVLGNYSVAVAMCSAWNMVGMSLTQAVAPYLGATRVNATDTYTAILRKFLGLMLALSVVGSAVLGVLAHWIFSVLVGPAYTIGAGVFAVLVWSSVPVFLGIATSQIILNEHLYWLSLLRTTLGMCFTLALIVPVASIFGVHGVAWLVITSGCIATGSILFSKSAREQIAVLLVPRLSFKGAQP